jgi:hypothetical protein
MLAELGEADAERVLLGRKDPRIHNVQAREGNSEIAAARNERIAGDKLGKGIIPNSCDRDHFRFPPLDLGCARLSPHGLRRFPQFVKHG